MLETILTILGIAVMLLCAVNIFLLTIEHIQKLLVRKRIKKGLEEINDQISERIKEMRKQLEASDDTDKD